MAYCPFAADETFELAEKKNPDNKLSIRTGYVIPVQVDGLWYYRVEYHLAGA